jgi:superfamily II DNA or RNA helicase
MSEIIQVQKRNEVFLNISCDAGVAYEMRDHFSFFVPGHQHMPLFKMKAWDGKINLFNPNKGLLYCGLFEELKEFCRAREYTIEIHESPMYGLPGELTNVTPEQVHQFVDGLGLPEGLDRRVYQLEAIYTAVRYQRKVLLSPTASGKSFIIYAISEYLMQNELAERVLIVVPTTALVHQMVGDFKSYGLDSDEACHKIMGGYEKNSDKRYFVSTWQSLMKQPAQWFQKFDAVFIDETHLAKSTELTKILEKMTNTKYRYGLTGSLDNAKTHHMMIQAILGSITRVAKTRDLIDDGHLSEISIDAILLNYSKETKSLLKGVDYQKEIDFLVAHERRNKFIRNLALSIEGNTLILYAYVERHGQVLYDMIKERAGDRQVFFVHGGVDAEDREEVRHITEASNNAIIVASYGTMSTGTNIKRLNNIIAASPTKSVIRVLQSIGRGLRKAHDKDTFKLYDIADDLSNSKKNKNYTYKHFIERLNIYVNEEFPYKIITLEIE